MRHWFEMVFLPEGWRSNVRLTVSEGRIARVETGVAPEPGDERHGPAIPGMANLHSHAFQRAIAGLTERSGNGDDSFWTWREAMYSFAANLCPDAMEAVAAMAYVEMLESGYTRVGEFHYLHHDRDGAPYENPARMCEAIVSAASIAQIGLTLLPVFYAHSSVGGTPPQERQRRFVNDLSSYAVLLDGAKAAVAAIDHAMVGVAPHSLRAITPGELAEVLALAKDGPVHIHIAEQVAEVEECLAGLGARPVDWLMDNAPVGPDWCLVHATHVTDSELAKIAASGATVGLCPITEANLGDGIFPARKFQELGGHFGVGTDSNVDIDLAGELRLLEYGQRLTIQRRNALGGGPDQSTGGTIWRGALNGGARATGCVCEIAVGQPANIVSFLPGLPTHVLAQPDNVLDRWIFTRDGRHMVDKVWSLGRLCVTSGRHVRREEVVRKFDKVMGAAFH